MNPSNNQRLSQLLGLEQIIQTLSMIEPGLFGKCMFRGKKEDDFDEHTTHKNALHIIG